MSDAPEREEDRIGALLAAVPALAGHDLTIEPLAGGMTNRNYLVDADGDAYVVRVAGVGTGLLGIDRDSEVACAKAAAAVGVAPDTIAYLREEAIIVARFVAGRVLKAHHVRKPRTLRRVAQTLRRFHESAIPPEATDFSPFAMARRYYESAKERGLPAQMEVDHALGVMARIEQELRTEEPPCLCHNDLLPANFIDDGKTLWIIDWEFGARGDRFFDLGNLAANGEFGAEQEQALVEAYFGEVRPADLRRVRLMRLASDMREAMWGYLQSVISQLHNPEFYIGYGSTHLRRFLAGSTSMM